MDTALQKESTTGKKPVFLIPAVLAAAGLVGLVALAAGGNPHKAWLIYLTNFLLFTAFSLGALVFSTMMHFTKAKWSRKLQGVAEAFSSFFPLSFILFLLLFAGCGYVFPWAGENLHGKEVWLNVPFLFTRDIIGFLVLYALGFGFIYHSLRLRLKNAQKDTPLKRFLFRHFEKTPWDEKRIKKRMSLFAGWYMFAFAVVLSLVGFDLVMSMDPHWYSTLFGAYTFIKAIYGGLAFLILAAAVLHMSPKTPFSLTADHFRDVSTMLFGFSIVWGDFFYSQFLVIWYGNIPEETAYVIQRTMLAPWKYIAWTVFVICFIMPFIVLLNRKIKSSPRFMAATSMAILLGLWLEHFLLLGPSYHDMPASRIPPGISETVISAGLAGLFVLAVIYYFRQFPELLETDSGEAR